MAKKKENTVFVRVEKNSKYNFISYANKLIDKVTFVEMKKDILSVEKFKEHLEIKK